MFNKIKHNIKSTSLSIWKNKYWLLAISFVLLWALASLNYKMNSCIASTQMSLNYAEASYGLNPNSTRFSIYEFTGDEVMEKAIHYAGLDGKISADELAKCIKIRQIDTKETNKEAYITTSYSITYDGRKIDTDNRSAENMLNLICQAYKEYFMDNYGENQSLLTDGPTYNYSNEPFLRLNALSIRADQLERYIDARIYENKSFVDENLDYTFTSLLKKMKNIIDYDIPNIEAFILESGVAESQEKFISTLEYINLVKKMRYDTFKAYYDSDNDGIDMYDVIMSAIVMIPSENKKNEYYMSRTQTAIDYLAKDADSNLKDATYIQEELTQTDYMISQIKKSHGLPTAGEKNIPAPMVDENTNKANINKTNAMLSKLEEDLAKITEDLKVLDTSYIKYHTQDYLMFRNSTPSFSKKIDIKKLVIEEAVFLIICFMIIYIKASRRKERS